MGSRSLRGMRRNRDGGIEGLPLQLMIIILVATLGTGIIVGWMGSLDTPKFIGSVTADDEIINVGTWDSGIGITVRDQNGDPLEGAVVSLTGCGIRSEDGGSVNGITDRDGHVKFEKLTMAKDTKIRYIDVEAVKPDFGTKKTQIVVIP